MNQKIIIPIIAIVFIGAIIGAQPVGINFIIDIQPIPQDGVEEGSFVQAQAWNFGNGQFKIIIDPSVVDSPQINRIVAHEIGHVVDWEGDEEYADNFANRIVNDGSEPIVDKYHGIH